MWFRPFLVSSLIVLAALSGCAGDTTPSPAPAVDPCANASKAGLTLSNASHTVVALATSKGCIVAELYESKAPITTANFKKLANDNFYTGLLFHRIIQGFMVQTGGMKRDGAFKESPYPPIKNEAKTSGLKNLEFTLSMARTGDPDSATNQFFINVDDNAFLDPTSTSAGYAVFGIVVSGRDVVEKIENVPVEGYAPGRKCQQDSQPSCPKEEVVLQSIKVI